MIQLKKILVPTDFSHNSDLALQYASALAGRFKAKLFVINVCDPMPAVGPLVGYYYDLECVEKVKEQEWTTLNRIVEEISARGVEAEAVFTTGRADTEIIKQATDLDVDLIVLATHGRSGLSHLVFGSTAEKVLRLAPCPVMTVKYSVQEAMRVAA